MRPSTEDQSSSFHDKRCLTDDGFTVWKEHIYFHNYNCRNHPSISYWFHGDANPLQSYPTSSKKMKKLDVDYVIPSQGKLFYGANDRIDELLKHHEDRLVSEFTSCRKLQKCLVQP